jgi:hypothetical protein
MCPLVKSAGRDFPWAVDERIPRVAGVIDDASENLKSLVEEPVVDLPD